MARELKTFQDAHGITSPITVEQVESAHAMDVRCGNWEHERAWDVFGDMIATASRRLPKPDGQLDPYAIDWHPLDPTTLVYAPESFWDVGGVL